jgi:uridine phosphorylase
MDREAWLRFLGLQPDEVPGLLVLEGTWWRARALSRRLPHLLGARETGMPDLWVGTVDGAHVAYCPAYGSARAVEPVHVLGVCGTQTVVQIGSCGGLQPHVRTGDVVLSDRATIGEGASAYYDGVGTSRPDPALVRRAAGAFGDLTVHVGPTVSTDALLQQSAELLARWAGAGHLGVDMETSAVFSAAAVFGLRALSLLFVWDELPARSWTDAFTAQETAAQRRAEQEIFRVALQVGRADVGVPRGGT